MPDDLFVDEQGNADRPPLVLIHTLWTDHSLWAPILPQLPATLRVLCPDLPGHGKSGPRPGKIGAFVAAVESALDARDVKETVVVGHGLGGLVAQGLATKRLDLVRGLVLSGTATKIETRARWHAVSTAIRREGPSALARHVGRRWDGPQQKWLFDADPAKAENLARAADALAGADFYTTTAALRLPSLIITGARDAFTPPDIAYEMASLISGCRTAILRNAGHFAMCDAPTLYAETLTEFLSDIGHLGPPKPSR